MRDREKYESVEIKCRPNEPEALYDGVITASHLAAHPPASGDVREVLDAFRQADRFDCTPVTVDGELAVEKSTTE